MNTKEKMYNLQCIKNLRLFTQNLDTWKSDYDRAKDFDSLFALLCETCSKEYDLDFEEFIQDYSKSSSRNKGTLFRMKRHICWKDDIIENYLRVCLCQPEYDTEKLAEIRDDDIKKLDKINPAIIYCLKNGVLPFFDETPGDITQDYLERTLDVIYNDIKRYYPSDGFFEGTPFLLSQYKKTLSKIRNSDVYGRMFLYDFVYQVMGNILILNNKDSYYDVNVEIKALDLSSICYDNKKNLVFEDADNPMNIWMFEKCFLKTYYLTHYKMDRKTYVRYEVSVFEEADGQNRQMYVLHPRGVIDMLRGKPISDKDKNYFEYKEKIEILKESDKKKKEDESKKYISEIFLKNLSNTSWNEFPRHFVRKTCTESFENYTNEFPEFDHKVSVLNHIKTDDYLFVERSSKKLDDDLRSVTSYYRIPADLYEGFYSVDQKDVILLYTHKHHKYLFSNGTLWHAEVTSPEDCFRQSIAIVPFVTAISTKPDKFIFINKIEVNADYNAGKLTYSTHLSVNHDNEDSEEEPPVLEYKEEFSFTDNEGNPVNFIALTEKGTTEDDVKLNIRYSTELNNL